MSKLNDLFTVRSCDVLAYESTFRVLDTKAETAPIIPISAQFNHNIDVVCDYLARKIPIAIKDFTSSSRMTSKRR